MGGAEAAVPKCKAETTKRSLRLLGRWCAARSQRGLCAPTEISTNFTMCVANSPTRPPLQKEKNASVSTPSGALQKKKTARFGLASYDAIPRRLRVSERKTAADVAKNTHTHTAAVLQPKR